jgi:hypothetical protein
VRSNASEAAHSRGSPNNFVRTYDCAKPLRSTGGRAGGYRGAAEEQLQLFMGQAAWMTACKQMPPKARGPLLKNIGLYEAGHIYSLPRVHQ